MKYFTLIVFIFLGSSVYSQTEILNTEYEMGKYVDGYKDGEWSYYDQAYDLALKINYTSAKLIYLKPDTSDYVVKINGEWVKNKLDIPPRYIGSMHEFYRILSKISYPKNAINRNTCGTFYISFEIDSTGSAGNYEVLHDIGDGCGKSALTTLQNIPNVWLAAQKGSNVYNARYILPVTFEMELNFKPIEPNKIKDDSPLPLARELDEVTIKVLGIKRQEYYLR